MPIMDGITASQKILEIMKRQLSKSNSFKNLEVFRGISKPDAGKLSSHRDIRKAYSKVLVNPPG